MLNPAYAAGLFDGEGCVSLTYTVRRRRARSKVPILGFKFVVLICNTHLATLEHFQRTYGGYIHRNTKRKRHRKLVWTWRLTSFTEQQRFLETIQSHCRIKRPAVRLGLLYLTTAQAPGRRTTDAAWRTRMSVYRALTRVNKRGVLSPKRGIPHRPPEGWRPSRRFTPRELHAVMRRLRDKKITVPRHARSR